MTKDRSVEVRIIPWDKNRWFSPRFVINEWEKIMRAGDKKKIKKAEEAWVCAIAMICLSKDRQSDRWIQIPPFLNDPPDVLAMELVPSTDGLVQDLREYKIEIFEISQFDKNESIENSIKRKLGLKDYTGMHLIGFVRRECFFDNDDVVDFIGKLKPKALSVSILLTEPGGKNEKSLIQLFPKYRKCVSDYVEFCKNSTQIDYIDVTRATKIVNGTIHETNEILTLIP